MSDRKTEFRFFTIMEYEKEQEYLREMHQAGWKFAAVTFPGFYHFEKGIPEDVVYQLDYNQEGIAHKEEYVQMFQDCGWEYLTDFVGYSYFRKPVSGLREEEGIFCDDSSRLEMMKRVFQGRMLPLLAVFLCVIVPQLCFQFQTEQWNRWNYILTALYAALLVLYILIFAQFGLQYWNFKQKVR